MLKIFRIGKDARRIVRKLFQDTCIFRGRFQNITADKTEPARQDQWQKMVAVQGKFQEITSRKTVRRLNVQMQFQLPFTLLVHIAFHFFGMYPYERAEQQKRDEIEYEHEKRYDSLSDRATPVALFDQRCQQELIDDVELDPFPGIDDVIAVNDFVFELEFAAHISVAHHNGIVENDAVVDQGVVADDRTRTDAGIFSQLDRTAENDRCADRDAFWNLYIAPYDECGAVAVPRQVVTCGLFIYDPHVLLIKHLNGIDRSNFKDIGTELHFRRGVREIGEPVPADQIPAVRFSKSPAAKGVRVELQRFGFRRRRRMRGFSAGVF